MKRWKVHEHALYQIVEEGERGPVIAEVATADDFPSDEECSNARLIAAAPDLRAAAEKALAVHEDVGCSCRGCAALRAALAKARGES